MQYSVFPFCSKVGMTRESAPQAAFWQKDALFGGKRLV